MQIVKQKGSIILKKLAITPIIKTSISNYFAGLILMVVVLNSSCTSTKQVIYFNALADSAGIEKAKIAQINFENKIQKNDQLWITIGGSNPNDLVALNSGGGSVTGSAGQNANTSIFGYLVEADGNIKMPYVGKVIAEGLTRVQLESILTNLFKEYTKNPIVNVRFLNYSFSVLGEVGHSGRYNMNSERATILEAISSAGDITELGRRDNVLVIREVNGERTFTRVNLLSGNVFNSPVFYLKINDIVYVEPVKAKFINRSGIPQYLAIVAVGLSLILTILNLRK